MKKIVMIVVLVLMSQMFISCSKVPAGHVGIKVFLLGGSKGVDSQELGVGRYYIGLNEELYLFPTYQQNYVWTRDTREGSPNDESFTFQTREGMEIGADFGISYHIDPKKVNLIFEKYRKGIEEITDIYLRNNVRDALNSAASVRKVIDVYGSGKTKLIKEVEDLVRKEVEPIGIRVDKIYLIGSFRLPQTVINALNSKIEATQMAQQRVNEIETEKAEALKKEAKAKGEANAILKVAQAQAKANLILAKSITKELVEYKRVEKWNGVLPQVSGGSTPFVNLGK